MPISSHSRDWKSKKGSVKGSYIRSEMGHTVGRHLAVYREIVRFGHSLRYVKLIRRNRIPSKA